MTTYIALLRGIMPMNPNMRNEKICAVLAGLGFKNVRAVIASGNFIFEASGPAKSIESKIEKALPAKLGFNSTAIVRSAEELQKLVKRDPFKGVKDTPTSRLNVTFLKKGGEVCSVINPTVKGSPLVMLELEKKHGKEITTRTWKTVHRILAKAA